MAPELSRKREEFQNGGFEKLGPGVQRRLYAAGIDSYEKLASTSFDELHELVQDIPGYTLENIIKWDWPAEARKRIPEPALAEPEGFALHNSQRNATFTLELLINPDDTVRRVRAKCIHDGAAGSWSGWNEPELVEFVVQHASLDRSSIESPALTSKEGIQIAHDTTPSRPPLDDATEAGPEEQFAVFDLAVSLADTAGARTSLLHGQSFMVNLGLDLPECITGNGKTWTYQAQVRAKALGTDSWQDVAQTRGVASQGGALSLQVPGTVLPRGLYRLGANASLHCEAKQLHLETYKAGELLHVY